MFFCSALAIFRASTVTRNHWQPHAITQSHTQSHTITRNHSHTRNHTITQSHNHTITQSHNHTITQSHNHTITHTQSHTHTHTHTICASVLSPVLQQWSPCLPFGDFEHRLFGPFKVSSPGREPYVERGVTLAWPATHNKQPGGKLQPRI